jgi:hypothetical protein
MRVDALFGLELIYVESPALDGQLRRRVGGSGDVRACNLSWGSINLRHEDDFCPEGFEHAGASRAVARRHRDKKGMTENGASNGQTGSHISTRHFNNWRTWPQTSIFAGCKNDSARSAIFDAAAGLHKFCLRENPPMTFVDAVKRNERCVSDNIKGGWLDTRYQF